MDDLVTWLRAQLDEDERELGCDVSGMCDGGVHLDDDRWRAEVAAKRALIDACERWLDPHPGQPCTNAQDEWWERDACYLHIEAQKRNVNPFALRYLALAYAHHRPGYRPEWAPDADPTVG